MELILGITAQLCAVGLEASISCLTSSLTQVCESPQTTPSFTCPTFLGTLLQLESQGYLLLVHALRSCLVAMPRWENLFSVVF